MTADLLGGWYDASFPAITATATAYCHCCVEWSLLLLHLVIIISPPRFGGGGTKHKKWRWKSSRTNKKSVRKIMNPLSENETGAGERRTKTSSSWQCDIFDEEAILIISDWIDETIHKRPACHSFHSILVSPTAVFTFPSASPTGRAIANPTAHLHQQWHSVATLARALVLVIRCHCLFKTTKILMITCFDYWQMIPASIHWMCSLTRTICLTPRLKN